MPQPKSSRSSTAKRSTAKKTTKRSTSAKPRARKSTSAKKTTAKRTTAKRTTAKRGDADSLRERLVSTVTIPTGRLQELMDDAVKRGRMTRKDAEELITTLVSSGRSQTEALLRDIEQLLGRGRSEALKRGDRVLREVDRARRSAGVGSPFPILNYDKLTAAQITDRVQDLTPAHLRKVRDYERRNANRKSVLAAIEKKLG